MNLFRTVL